MFLATKYRYIFKTTFLRHFCRIKNYILAPSRRQKGTIVLGGHAQICDGDRLTARERQIADREDPIRRIDQNVGGGAADILPRHVLAATALPVMAYNLESFEIEHE